MHTLRCLGASALLVCLPASGAFAQSLRDRIWVSVNAGIQVPGEDISDRFEFERFVETAAVEVDYDANSSVFFDGGIGVLLWKRLGAAVAFSRFTHDGARRSRRGSRIPSSTIGIAKSREQQTASRAATPASTCRPPSPPTPETR